MILIKDDVQSELVPDSYFTRIDGVDEVEEQEFAAPSSELMGTEIDTFLEFENAIESLRNGGGLKLNVTSNKAACPQDASPTTDYLDRASCVCDEGYSAAINTNTNEFRCLPDDLSEDMKRGADLAFGYYENSRYVFLDTSSFPLVSIGGSAANCENCEQGDGYLPDSLVVWPQKYLNDRSTSSKTTEKLDEDGKVVERSVEQGPDSIIARALSSTVSIAQMRDLLTEPSFPSLQPMSREVELACIPPADNVVIESYDSLSAALKAGSKTQGNNALFRLCESSVNSPAGFRNIYPIIIHDIVRRTAEMEEQDEKAITERRVAAEATKQKQIDAQIASVSKEAKALEVKIAEANATATENAKQRATAEATTAEKQKELLEAVRSGAAQDITDRKNKAEAACLEANAAKVVAGDEASLDAVKSICAKLKE